MSKSRPKLTCFNANKNLYPCEEKSIVFTRMQDKDRNISITCSLFLELQLDQLDSMHIPQFVNDCVQSYQPPSTQCQTSSFPPPPVCCQQPSKGRSRRSRLVYLRDLRQSLTPKPRIQKGRVQSHCPHMPVSSGEMGAKKSPISKRSPLLRRRPGEVIPGKGVWCLWGQFGMHAPLYAPPSGKH